MDVAASTRVTLVTDLQGSVVGSLDSGSGTLTRWGYRPYGENPSLTTDSFAYTGQRHDPETSGSAAEPSGLYDYHARMYSPTLGRFLQPDPAGSAGSGGNLYAYAADDPINLSDPSGLFAESVANGASSLWDVYTDPSSYGNRDLYTGGLAGSLQTFTGFGDALQRLLPGGAVRHPEFSESFDYSALEDSPRGCGSIDSFAMGYPSPGGSRRQRSCRGQRRTKNRRCERQYSLLPDFLSLLSRDAFPVFTSAISGPEIAQTPMESGLSDPRARQMCAQRRIFPVFIPDIFVSGEHGSSIKTAGHKLPTSSLGRSGGLRSGDGDWRPNGAKIP
jgi:RHS repeat-associated protein